MAEEEKETETKSGGGVMKIAVLGLVGVVLVIGVQLGTMIMVKSMMPDLMYPEWIMAMAPPPEEAEVPSDTPPIYTKMNPPVVVSYQNGDSVRFLQVTLEAMARNEQSIDAFQLHSPHIRNNLLLMFASESLEKLSTIEGKELMRKESLQEVNEILQAESPGTKIEELYFTAFVVQ